MEPKPTKPTEPQPDKANVPEAKAAPKHPKAAPKAAPKHKEPKVQPEKYVLEFLFLSFTVLRRRRHGLQAAQCLSLGS